MLTFQQIYEDAQEQLEDDSTTTLTLIKRAINQGAKLFGAVLNKEWRQSEKSFSLVANQQFYPLPRDTIRLSWITVTIGGVVYTLQEIADADTWNKLNYDSTTSDIPEYFFIRGNDEVGIYPTPASNQSNAATFAYERRMRDMSAADFSTGTVTVTNNDATVTHSGTSFTNSMAGRWFKVADPDGDGMWYQIDSVTDTANVELANVYAGDSAAGLSYSIAEIPDIPEEFHESLVDYACYRMYLRRRDRLQARDMKSLFDDAVETCKTEYSSKTSSAYYRVPKFSSAVYQHHSRDYKVT